jgi:hypothetical protein
VQSSRTVTSTGDEGRRVPHEGVTVYLRSKGKHSNDRLKPQWLTFGLKKHYRAVQIDMQPARVIRSDTPIQIILRLEV